MVERATNKAEDLPAAESPRTDAGSTFIELLVALVLIGTTVVAVLVALQASTVASTTDAQHARAYAWLHNASDSVFEATRVACNRYTGPGDAYSSANAANNTNPANWPSQIGDSNDTTADGTVWGVYNDAVRSTPAPNGFAGASIAITKIEFLKPVSAESNTFEWGAACFEGVIPDTDDPDTAPDDYRQTPLVSQKVTITVTGPNGFTKSLETVKAK